MGNAIKKTCPTINLNTSTEKTVQIHVDTSGVMRGQYRVRRICTKTDNALKSVIKAHLKERASHHIIKSNLILL